MQLGGQALIYSADTLFCIPDLVQQASRVNIFPAVFPNC